MSKKPKAPAHPPLQCLIYGAFGMKKTTFASTFPTPGYVVMFDSYGKATPYHRMGDDVERTADDNGVPVHRVYRGDTLLWEIHYYLDQNPEKPDAFALFRADIRNFDPTPWATFVFDSLTSAALSAYLEQRFSINPDDESKFTDKKQLKWRAGLTDQIEMNLCRRFTAYPNNVVVIAHSAEDTRQVVDKQQGVVQKLIRAEVGDEMLRGIAAPGRLAKANGLPSQYSEVYRANAKGTGKARKWYLQTESDDDWLAATQIGAPDGCEPHYDNLWTAN